MQAHFDKEDNSKNSASEFEHTKITMLNKFFMKKIFLNSIINLFLFLLSVSLLVVLLQLSHIDSGLKITLISMTATFILTTSKSMIDRTATLIQFLVNLLCEEQRGLSKTIGIEVDKVPFDQFVDSNSE